ncbi:hypothetical protein [Frigoribacterium sp. CG_9.8]|uniref:hypothetical protein n=1 Tax=Frigoribacterium sp. CG_9.8 TaxID=2787733 RepID=UPI0018CB05F9|nr:hypothetical protein [Frigoribacterium sp. CG_9.8]MBG6107756.1 hypothetical protein [Frigoribacterium sp. CG_9.8]
MARGPVHRTDSLTRRICRGRRALAVIAVASALMLLAGCAGGPMPDPLGPQRRQQIRQAILDAHWAPVVADYPDAIRPAVPTMTPVSDYDQPSAVLACLRSTGIPASPTDNGFRYSSTRGQSQLEAVRYGCSASAPSESELESYLSGSSRAALFDYRRTIVRPCLLAAGATSPAPPDGGATDYFPAALAAWNPFMEIRASQPRAGTVAYLEKRCPPLPSWLVLTE